MDQIDLVVRARAHLAVEGDLAGADADLAFGPMHRVAAFEVATEGGVVTGVGHRGLYLLDRRIVGGDQDGQEIHAQAEAEAEGEYVGGEQDEDAAHGASLWVWIARHGAGQDHLGRLRATFIDTVPKAKRAQRGACGAAALVAEAGIGRARKLNDAFGLSRRRPI
ncbi:hypothetical protein D3C81_704000 [compost metagenome]